MMQDKVYYFYRESFGSRGQKYLLISWAFVLKNNFYSKTYDILLNNNKEIPEVFGQTFQSIEIDIIDTLMHVANNPCELGKLNDGLTILREKAENIFETKKELVGVIGKKYLNW